MAAFQKKPFLNVTGFNFLCQIEATVNENTLSQCPEMLEDGDIKKENTSFDTSWLLCLITQNLLNVKNSFG